MDFIFGFAHITGAVIATLALGIGVFFLDKEKAKINKELALGEISIALGMTRGQLEDPDNNSRVIQFLAERFSSEKFQNRLSDFCLLILLAWRWFGFLMQVGIFVGVIYYTFIDGPTNAINAWWVLAVEFFFWITAVFFAFFCKLLTGRSPGQAMQVRKILTEFVSNRGNYSRLYN